MSYQCVIQAAVAAQLQLDLVKDWTCSATCIIEHAGPIRLRHACYVTVGGQRAAAASQPAGWCRLTACGPTDQPEVSAAKV